MLLKTHYAKRLHSLPVRKTNFPYEKSEAYFLLRKILYAQAYGRSFKTSAFGKDLYAERPLF